VLHISVGSVLFPVMASNWGTQIQIPLNPYEWCPARIIPACRKIISQVGMCQSLRGQHAGCQGVKKVCLLLLLLLCGSAQKMSAGFSSIT